MIGCVPGVLTRVLTSQTSCAATVERLLWKGCFVTSGLVPDGVSPPYDSLKSLAIQSTEIRYASPEFSRNSQGATPRKLIHGLLLGIRGSLTPFQAAPSFLPPACPSDADKCRHRQRGILGCVPGIHRGVYLQDAIPRLPLMGYPVRNILLISFKLISALFI